MLHLSSFLRQDMRVARILMSSFLILLPVFLELSCLAVPICQYNQLCFSSTDPISEPKLECAINTHQAIGGFVIGNGTQSTKSTLPFQKFFQKKAIKRLGKWRPNKDPKNKGLQPLFGLLLGLSGFILSTFVFLGFLIVLFFEGGFSVFFVLIILAGLAAAVGLFYLAAQKLFPNASKKYHKRFAWLATLGCLAFWVIGALLLSL